MSDKVEASAGKLADTAARVSTSTRRMEASTGAMEDSADRRTQLAADRTILAAERTYAAWVRTGLASLASGVGAKAALGGVIMHQIVLAAGSVLVLFSAFCFAAAVWRELSAGAPPPKTDTRKLPAPLLLAVNGFLVLVALSALVGLWFGASGKG